MYCPRLLAALAAVALAAANASAEAPAAYEPCVACHGPRGEGNPALDAPALAGQGEAYLARQLRHFRAGIRGADPADTQGAQMRAMATTLSTEDIPAVASYLAALEPPAVTPAAGADLRNGNNYYHSRCGACHGGSAEGNPGLNAPALAWLDSAYLKRQFRNFQRGLRGDHPDDTYGRQMKMMSTTLPAEKDLDDVIAFIQSLAPEN